MIKVVLSKEELDKLLTLKTSLEDLTMYLQEIERTYDLLDHAETDERAALEYRASVIESYINKLEHTVQESLNEAQLKAHLS